MRNAKCACRGALRPRRAFSYNRAMTWRLGPLVGCLISGVLAVAGCGGGGGGGGHGSTREIGFVGGVRGTSPRFSRDGTRLAYNRDQGSFSAVAVMTTEGTGS